MPSKSDPNDRLHEGKIIHRDKCEDVWDGENYMVRTMCGRKVTIGEVTHENLNVTCRRCKMSEDKYPDNTTHLISHLPATVKRIVNCAKTGKREIPAVGIYTYCGRHIGDQKYQPYPHKEHKYTHYLTEATCVYCLLGAKERLKGYWLTINQQYDKVRGRK